MGTTADFLKLRSAKTPKVGVWNIDFATAISLAKENGKFIVALWSNGDACNYCVTAEKCMLTDTFKKWIATQDVYFVFQYSGDKDKGKAAHDWIYNKTGLKIYPGFRVTLYDKLGNIVFDKAIEGNSLRNSKTGEDGANAIINNLSKMFSANVQLPDIPEPASYTTRLNEKLTVKKINKVLDAIDNNDGYCPCQPKTEDTKCHCKDYIYNKNIGEPCICNIYVKKEKVK